MKSARIDAYIRGDSKLPAAFTTGYQRDLEVARDIVRRRRGQHIETAAPRQQETTVSGSLAIQAE